MSIRLNVSKQTFKNYLIKAGYSYDINQYEDFIFAIKRMIISDIKESFDNGKTKEVLDLIFGRETDIYILADIKNINVIRIKYLKDLIENSRLDLFLEEGKEVKFTKEIQELAYKKEIYNNICKKENNHSVLSYSIEKSIVESSYIENKIKKCIGMDGIYLTESEKTNIYKEEKNNILKKILFYNIKNEFITIEKILNINEENIEKYINKKEIISNFFLNKLIEKVDIKKKGINLFSMYIKTTNTYEIDKLLNNYEYTWRINEEYLKKFIIYITSNNINYMDNFINKLLEEELFIIKNEKEEDLKKRINLFFSNKETDIYKRIDYFLEIFNKYYFKKTSINSIFKYILRKKKELIKIQKVSDEKEIMEIKYSDISFSVSLKEIKEFIDEDQ